MQKLGSLRALVILAVITLLGSQMAVFFSVSKLLMILLVGIVVGNTLRFAPPDQLGFARYEKLGLGLAISLLGTTMSLGSLASIGWFRAFAVLLISLSVVALGAFLGRRLGLSRDLGLLIGVGTGICGSAAVATCAPFVTKDKQGIGLALTTINLTGLLGLALVPALSSLGGFDWIDSGFFIGASLQSLGHVVAASFSLSELAGQIATLTKVERVMLLAPLVLFLSYKHGKSEGRKGFAILPVYLYLHILGFIAANLWLFPEELMVVLNTLCHMALGLGMAAIGVNIRLAGAVQRASRSLLLAFILFFVQVLSLGLLILA